MLDLKKVRPRSRTSIVVRLLPFADFCLYLFFAGFLVQDFVKGTHTGIFFNLWRVAVDIIRTYHDLFAFDAPKNRCEEIVRFLPYLAGYLILRINLNLGIFEDI